MPTSYHIEKAKSGRAKCKKCKVPIAKDELRIGASSEVEGQDYQMTSWYHTECFTLPRAMKDAGVEGFVDEHLGDPDGLLGEDETRREVEAAISSKLPRKSVAAPTPPDSFFATVKHHAEDDPSGEPEAKKPKLSEEEQHYIEVYNHYKNMTVDELKDYMRWNRQAIGGGKMLQVRKCLDGHLFGRLDKCPLCTRGRLAIPSEYEDVAKCQGWFDEEARQHVPCSYVVPLAKAPRLQPWFKQKPSEEEETEMDALAEAKKKGSAPEGAVEDLLEKASKVEWKTGNKDGLKATAAAMLKLCKEASLKLPEQAPEKAVGKFIASNRNGNPKDVMQIIVDEYGFEDKKQEAAAAQAASDACAVPANAACFQMLQEFASLFRKGGDYMKANAYLKASQAVAELKEEITAENALKFGKSGKHKVAGIGKSTAEKMHELLTTGNVESLETLKAGIEG